MTDDRRLVAAVLAEAENPGAFADLVRRHERLVWHVVGRMVNDPEDTRELCQDVFLRVHRRLRQFRHESSLATWIGRIAFSIAARHLRRKRLPLVRESDAIDPEWSPLERLEADVDLEADAIRRDDVRRVERSLERLAPLERTVVTLYHLDELSIPEIVQITSLPSGTVKSHLFRARRKLRAALERDEKGSTV